MAGNGEVKSLPSADSLRVEIERAREQIASSAASLKADVALTTDWREWVRSRPGTCLAAAFTLGFLLGTKT